MMARERKHRKLEEVMSDSQENEPYMYSGNLEEEPEPQSEEKPRPLFPKLTSFWKWKDGRYMSTNKP